MPTVKVICRKSSKDKYGKCPLRIRITHERRTREITLPGARVKPSEWDDSVQGVKGGGMLNVRIEGEVLKYKKKFNEWMALGRPIDLDVLIDEVQGKKTSTGVCLKLTDYIKEHFEFSRQLAWATKKNYTAVM